MAAYATPTDLLARKDARTLGDLVTDVSERVSPEDLLTDTKLQAALDDASGEIDAALLQGKRYSVADLTALNGNSQKYLIRLTCDIAWGLLCERRSYGVDDERRQAAFKSRREALERLRKGEHVFDLEAVKEAGLPSITGPTRIERTALNLISNRARGRFYPTEFLPDDR